MSPTAERPDFLVVGAGIAGAATAYHLASAGFAVKLVDTHYPAWGATGRNPGFLWLQTKAAGVAMDFALAGRRFAEELAERLPDFGFRRSGGLIVYRNESLADVAAAFAADRRAAGLPLSHITGAEARELCPCLSPAISGALWNPLDAHQITRLLVERLVAAAEAADAVVQRQRRVAKLLIEGDRCLGARLVDGEEIGAGTTVVAAGPWSNELLGACGLSFPQVPLRFEAAETAPAPFDIGPVVCGQALFKFFNASGKSAEDLPSHPAEAIGPDLGFTEQIAQFPDGTLQFGCAFEYESHDDRATVAGQAIATGVMADNVTGFAALPLNRVWAGIVGQTPDGLPVIDADPGIAGLAINAGHFFGNLVGAYAGRLLGEALRNQAPAFPLAPFRIGRFQGAF